MGKTIQFNPQEDAPVLIQMDEKNMAALFVMIEDIVRKVVQQEMNLATEKPMDADAVASFFGWNVTTVRLKTRKGLIPFHELEPGGHKYYFASEINQRIKAKK